MAEYGRQKDRRKICASRYGCSALEHWPERICFTVATLCVRGTRRKHRDRLDSMFGGVLGRQW